MVSSFGRTPLNPHLGSGRVGSRHQRRNGKPGPHSRRLPVGRSANRAIPIYNLTHRRPCFPFLPLLPIGDLCSSAGRAANKSSRAFAWLSDRPLTFLTAASTLLTGQICPPTLEHATRFLDQHPQVIF